MIRTIAIAAIAAAVASPALAQEIRVPVAGKSSVELQTEVETAVRRLCLRAVEGETLKLQAFGRCVDSTLEATLAKIDEPQRLAAR